MKEYPFKALLKEKADESGKSIVALAKEIDKTDRWVHSIKSINDLTLDMILKVSRACQFDFLADYNKWVIDQGQPPFLKLEEPLVNYEKQKNLSVSISLRGTVQAFNNGFGDLLEVVKKEGEKNGFEVL